MRKNIYSCSKGHSTVTVDRDEGVTPFMIHCPEEGCEERARSHFYRVSRKLPATHEWYKPSDEELRTRWSHDPGTLHHVQQGGLLLRKIEP